MSFQLGLTLGLVAGFYLGAKAGPERLEMITSSFGKVLSSDITKTLLEQSKGLVNYGMGLASKKGQA